MISSTSTIYGDRTLIINNDMTYANAVYAGGLCPKQANTPHGS